MTRQGDNKATITTNKIFPTNKTLEKKIQNSFRKKNCAGGGGFLDKIKRVITYRRLSVVVPQLLAVVPWATRAPSRQLFRAALAYPVPATHLLYGITEQEVTSRTHVVP